MFVAEYSLGSILEGSNQYRIPLYQREYSWQQKNWQKLWEDILDLASARSRSSSSTHFTGTLVLEARNVTAGLTEFLVVDGQQRLTTLSLLLAAIADVWKSANEEHAYKRVRDQYLVNTFAESADRHYRLRPGNFDEQDFRDAVEGRKGSDSRSRVTAAFNFFQRKIRKLPEHDIDLRQLEDAVLNGLKFVQITASSDDNVYRIFESINNTGVGLTQSDLVRNFVFMALGSEGEKAHDSLWLPLIEGLSSDDVETVFWIDAQWRNPEVRKFDVYEAQKNYLKDFDSDRLISYLEQVLVVANVMRAQKDPDKVGDPVLRERVRRFSQLKIPGALVLSTRILYLFETGQIPLEEARRALGVLESYLVRRAIAAVPVNSIGRISASVAHELVGDVAQEVHKRLSSGRRKYLTDEEVRRAVMTTPRYTTGRHEHLKLILQWLLEEEQGKDTIDFDSMTVEHILPQNLSAEAREEFSLTLGPDDDLDDLHRDVVHTLGNLTLTNYNTELSNSPFSVKKEGRLQETGVMANRAIAGNDRWGPEEIRTRGERLARTAIAIWEGPDETMIGVEPDSLSSRVDEVLSVITPGRWTTYGDIAGAVGTVSQAAAQAVARAHAAEGAWRVLRAGGYIAPGFNWAKGSPHEGRSCQEVLEEEGVRFVDDAADPEQRITAEEIRSLLGEDDDDDGITDSGSETF